MADLDQKETVEACAQNFLTALGTYLQEVAKTLQNTERDLFVLRLVQKTMDEAVSLHRPLINTVEEILETQKKEK